jgi:flagellin-like hook-associated protein FlgL
MSIGDISLTAGMRNNLVALQNTANLVATTQAHLSTGKKVNSALDNPVEYFASQNMLNQANDLAAYKDGMSNGIQMIQAASQGITGITSLIAQAKSIAQSAVGASVPDKTALNGQYTTILAQIDKMAADSGFQGVNLLSAAGTYTVTFGNTANDNLGLTGKDTSTTGLTISNTAVWLSDANIQTDITSLNTATGTLRTQSNTLASNLSIITARQSFSTDMINVFQTGSDNLVLADTNQEGANMLMLQTRQSLGTTSLSLASQAAQAVLKLFG